jgi:hypothetical protein
MMGANLSADRVYRFSLWRQWDADSIPRRMVVIGLNPSTADEFTNDPTIRRCIGFAQREGCSGLVMLNLFAYRATDPRTMLEARARGVDIVGPRNDEEIRNHTRQPSVGFAPLVVCAWGAVHPSLRARAQEVRAIVSPAWCLGTSKEGHPRHPLYLRADTPLAPLR